MVGKRLCRRRFAENFTVKRLRQFYDDSIKNRYQMRFVTKYKNILETNYKKVYPSEQREK